MNTRSSRGLHNSSFVRGSRRSLSASRNNISIDLQDSTSNPKPRVVHSPVRSTGTKPKVQTPQNSKSTSTNQNIQHTQVMDTNNLNSSQNANMVQSDYPSVSNNNSQQTSNPINSEANRDTPMDSLIALMEQTMKNTREEFRRELISIRESISQIGNTNTSIPFRPPDLSNNFVDPNLLNFNMNTNPNPQANHSMDFQTKTTFNGESNVKLEKWKISYDGSGSVSDFLFKVDTLRSRAKCSDEHILSNFHVLLAGKAEQWYWLYTKQNRDVSYPILCSALTREFGHLESDHDIILKISLRKQQYKEVYDDFHTAIISMNSRLRTPLPDSTLIDIVKRNVNSNLRFLLFNSEARSMNDFRDIARRAEKVLRDNKFQNPNLVSNRNVSELESSICEDNELEDNDPQLEAIHLSRKRNQNDYSQIQCWNCMSLGHSYIYCPEEIRKAFCFKCGLKGVLTPKCPNKHGLARQGNQKTGEMATGDTRPVHPTPSLN
ncbi:hypothetical protein CVS40_9864 [Lucilia cuprina]|nr:hypothetical protein CVS40_9864 [Lucilia cuprina]